MLYIEPSGTDAAFHFASEEYFMRSCTINEPIIMIWQAENTAMLGVNQIAEAEVNMPKARDAGVSITRRASGGGTIYTDMGSILYTFILPYGLTVSENISPIDILRKNVASPVIAALSKLGIKSELIGRNDILIDGKKVSGLAQYTKNGKICTHGSLLYDTNLKFLSELITANPEKFQSKALASVRSRVGNIKDVISVNENGTKPTTIEFWSMFKHELLEGKKVTKYTLNADEVAEINVIRNEKFANDNWTYARAPKFTYSNRQRFEGGSLEVFFDVQNGVIADCKICGDFLAVSPISELEAMLKNQQFNRKSVEAAIGKTPLRLYLGGVLEEEFLQCVFENSR